MLTQNRTPIRDTGTGEHSQVDEPQTSAADDVDNQPTGEAESQGDSVTYTADDIENKPAENDYEPEPQTSTQWPHEAIVKTVQGEDKTVKQTKSTKKKAS